MATIDPNTPFAVSAARWLEVCTAWSRVRQRLADLSRRALCRFDWRRPAVVQFDADFYLDRYPDVARLPGDPLDHYRKHGWRECRDPNAWLSTAAYLRRYPELLVTGEDPLSHLARLSRAGGAASRGGGLTMTASDAHGSLISALVQAQPEFLTKWWSREYLARGLSDVERARSHMHTFAVLEAAFPAAALRSMLFDGLALWRGEADGPVEVRFGLASAPNEGELALSFTRLGETLAILSFNILPPDVLEPSGRDRVLIARMQTAPEHRTRAREVSKTLGDVTLQACLFAALRGLAQALGIAEVLGVPASRQVSLKGEGAQRALAVYDAFFESVGAELTGEGFYAAAVDAAERPLSEVKTGHRIRTRRKRALKQAIATCATSSLETRRLVASSAELAA